MGLSKTYEIWIDNDNVQYPHSLKLEKWQDVMAEPNSNDREQLRIKIIRGHKESPSTPMARGSESLDTDKLADCVTNLSAVMTLMAEAGTSFNPSMEEVFFDSEVKSQIINTLKPYPWNKFIAEIANVALGKKPIGEGQSTPLQGLYFSIACDIYPQGTDSQNYVLNVNGKQLSPARRSDDWVAVRSACAVLDAGDTYRTTISQVRKAVVAGKLVF